jgi:hypothetical protein
MEQGERVGLNEENVESPSTPTTMKVRTSGESSTALVACRPAGQ